MKTLFRGFFGDFDIQDVLRNFSSLLAVEEQ